MTSEESDIEHLSKLVKGIQFAMFTTHNSGSDAELRSRPMTIQATEFDGDFWFFSGKDATVSMDVIENPSVCLGFSQPKSQAYVSVQGEARLVDDRTKMQELWSPAMKAWFPLGVDDPNLVLICVHVKSADYWEAPNSKVVQLYAFVRAALTGQPPKTGEIGQRGHVQMDH